MGETGERAALHALRDAARELLVLEADPALDDAAVAPARAAALRRYRSYVRRFGALNRGELVAGRPDPQTGEPALRWRRPALGGFRTDPHYFTVMALEVFDQDTGRAEPAPILLRRVHGSAAPVAAVGSPDEAILVCRGEGGSLDLERVARLLGLFGAAAAERALGDRIVADPSRGGAPVAVADYLSGDVRRTLAVARDAASDDERYRRNVELLEAVVPPEVGPLEIAVGLASPWLTAPDIEAFVREVLGGRVVVWHLPSAAHWWIVPAGRAPAGRYGTGRLNAYQVLAHGLNGRTPVVTDRVPGRGVRRNVDETLAAQDRLDALEERFAEWLWQDSARTARLVAEYNRRFTAHVPRRADGSGLTTPGLADGLPLWPWQRDVVARALGAPATLCAHPVGAGKTRAMAVLALTARRLGLARKPLVTVPAHLVEQTAREFRQAYPFGRFLVAGEEAAASPAPLAARCATGDWDAVIVSHGVLGALPLERDVERRWLEERIAAAEADVRGGRGGRHGRSLLRRRIAALEAERERVLARPDRQPTFESLGVDLLLVDEAHYFKRLPITSRHEGVSLGSSRRAADLLLKARTLRARRGSQPSLVLFTGTPWSNTISESYVWQSLLQPDRLAAAGIDTFDAWAGAFVEYEELVEVAPDSSGFRLKQRPARIRNLPELRAMLADVVDVLPPEALGLERPARSDDTVVCVPSPGQRAYLGTLELRADKIHAARARAVAGEDNMLALCGDGRRAALDPRLVDVDEDSVKVEALADRVARLHAEHRDTRYPGSDVPGVLQIVFCDQGTPGEHGLQTYGRVRRALAERGVPAEQIRWVHDATTSARRAALFAACRDGGVAVLLGSTDTLGTGANVQTRLRAIHHLDAPWRPADVEQREGRALRPGNLNPVVDVVRYVTRGTFDGYLWQTLERKARMVAQLQHGMLAADSSERTVEDLGEVVLGYAEVKALATGNPLLLEETRAAAEVARLRVLRALDAQTVTAAREAAATAEREAYRLGQQGRMLRSADERIASRPAPSAADDAAVHAAVAAVVDRVQYPDPAAPPAPIRVAWGGLGVELVPAGGWRAPQVDLLLVRVTLAHRVVDELRLPATAVRRGATAAAGRAVVRALGRWRAGLATRTAEVDDAAAAQADAAAAGRAVIAAHRFDRAGELASAEQRLTAIRAALESGVDDLEVADGVGA